ncbi:ABC transporter permease [Rhodococcoides kyotonense]|uniref:Peptide/nickel transport system permease protein n=1 Tax=Rhodococcoides kyotonense TaxID=398843 RepID=A0A239N2Z5_9NOCA|nr:ABC transporter permease [Rhodococcus kyotonensis]SNT48558.1 peptide/nickel transport system permease protein [Rhodococcus kyotonensis]
MFGYIVKRLASAGVVIFLVLTAIFFVTQLLGDPVQLVLGDTANTEQIAAVRERLGLDQPILQQYFNFVSNAFHGTFGDSFWQQQPALGLVLSRLPATFLLALATIAIIVPIGITLGVLAAYRQGSVIERIINVFSVMGSSLVSFWLALMLILLFAVTLRVLPTSGSGSFAHIILPATTLAILQIGTLAQVTRVGVAEQLTSSYVSAARARGLSPSRVMTRYALRNALIPIFTVSSSMVIVLVNGAVIAEVVFGWPGIGLLTLQAIQQGDLPLIQAAVFVTASSIVLLTLLVDLTYPWINPRVRLQ